MSKVLLITQCNDPLRWYADKVGQIVRYDGDAGNGEYRSRENQGYINFVLHSDSKVVEIDDEI